MAPDSSDPLEAELRRLVEALRVEGRAAAARERDLRDELKSLRGQLAAIGRDFKAFRSRRSVRLALAIAARARAVRGVVRPVGSGSETAPTPIRSRMPDGDAIRAAMEADGAAPARTDGPSVSIIVLTHNGEAHLRRLLPRLARVAYRDVEVLVVDNASSDGSLAYVEGFSARFPVRIVRNSANETFSVANNAAVRQANGEIVLFLNNDVEPVGDHWLGHMVETALDEDVAAVGARLVYADGGNVPRGGARLPDLSLQHAGIAFRVTDGVPMPYPVGAADDPRSAEARAVRDVPAATAACLLVRRSAFHAVGGYTVGYDYGLEDVDLCLKLVAAGGRIRYNGRAVLWHHEGATRVRATLPERRFRAAENRARFVGTWAPRLWRTTLADALRGGGFWRGALQVRLEPPGDATGTVDARRVAELERRGWIVDVGPVASEDAERSAGAGTPATTPSPRLAESARTVGSTGAPDPAPDVLIAFAPSRDIRGLPGVATLAFVSGDPGPWLACPWLPEFDMVVADTEATADAITALTGHLVSSAAPTDDIGQVVATVVERWLESPRVGIRTAVPSWADAPSWGDLHFAHDFQRALRRLGWPTRLVLRSEWAGGAAARDDVAVNLVGLGDPPTHPGQLNVLWHISHPDRATPSLYESHDLALVASASFARAMQERVTMQVLAFHQATDPDRFRPSDGGSRHELLFVANSRGVRRRLIEDLLPTEFDLAVYGKGWTPERLDPRYLRGELLPNDELAAHYASADIVLADHWPDMQREGFLSNRLYDAAASGSFVISDVVEGLAAEFDGGIVAYQGRAELQALIERFLADPEARAEHAARARAAVLSHHTFEHRARQFVAEVEPRLGERRSRLPLPSGTSNAPRTRIPDDSQASGAASPGVVH